MSKPDTEEIADEQDQEQETSLADPEDYHRKQRLKEIHQARQRVHKVLSKYDYSSGRKGGVALRNELAYAVAMYVTELENVIDQTDTNTTLPSHLPWDNIRQYADTLGYIPDDCDHPTDYAPRQNSIQVFRVCNRVLADVKPLIEEDETTEWEV